MKARNNWKHLYEETKKILAGAERDAAYYKIRAEVAEQEVEEHKTRLEQEIKKYYVLEQEFREMALRLPTGTTAIYLENLRRVNDALKHEVGRLNQQKPPLVRWLGSVRLFFMSRRG
jgi:hypothetical protein